MSEGGRPLRLARYLSIGALLVLNVVLIGLNLEKHGIFPFDDGGPDAGERSVEAADDDHASGPVTSAAQVQAAVAGADPAADPDQADAGGDPWSGQADVDTASAEGDVAGEADWPGERGPIPDGPPEPRVALIRADGTVELQGSVPTWAVATTIAERLALRQLPGSPEVVVGASWHPDASADPDEVRVLLDPPLRYDAGQVAVPEDAVDGLEAIAELMAADPQLLMTLTAHVDDLGDTRENRTVASARLIEARLFLEAADISPDRIIEVVAPADPDAPPNDTDAAKAHNRRVELELHNYFSPPPPGTG